MRGTLSLSRGLAVGAIGAIAIATAGIGVATAANGGSLVLGHSNTATKTTTLKDKKGTPLSLIGKKSKPPLKVNSNQLVKHLNAAEVGGMTPNDLSTGSGAQRDWNLVEALGGGGSFPVINLPHTTTTGSTTKYFPVSIAATGPLAPGTYLYNATVIASSSSGVFCWVSTVGTFPGTYQYGLVESGAPTATEAGFFKVTRQGQRLHEYCVNADGTDDGFVLSDSITALRVNHKINGTQTPPNATTTVRKKTTLH